MDPAERADRPPVPEDGPQHPVAPVLRVAQAVPVIQSRTPAGNGSGPGTDVVRHPDVLREQVTAPAIVVAGNPHDGYAAVGESRQGRQHLEAGTWHHRAPLEPEVEEVAVDHDRAGGPTQVLQESQEGPLNLRRCDAEVHIGEDETGRRQHAGQSNTERKQEAGSRKRGAGGGRSGAKRYIQRFVPPLFSAFCFLAIRMPDDQAHDIEFRVRYGETDRMGVVYHAEYLVWCEMGRTEYIRSLGMAYAEMERRGVPLAVAEATVRYHAPARYDDRIRVSTVLTRLGSRGLTFDYVIVNADSGARLATASTTLVALDPDGKAATIPADIRALLGRPTPR